MPSNPSTASAPIAAPFSNPDMACGRDGGKAVAITCPATAGSKLTFEFRGYPDYAKPDVIDVSHKGPISVYVKAMSSFDDAAAGDGWFKIWEQGYDAATNKYATEKLIARQGLLSVNLPDLPKGRYLVRTEIITLQNVTNGVVDPQFYSGCAQLYIESDKTTPLSIPSNSKVTIPGHLSPKDPGLIFNVYDLHRPAYIVPGPKVFFPGPIAPSKVKAAVPLSAAQGGIPDNCLLKNANWCGVEVPNYTNEDGCWASAEDCWNQSQVCHNTAPPTGERNCEVWEKKKCEVLQAACKAKRFTGPPNKGEKIEEAFARKVKAGDVPEAENMNVGEGVPEAEPKPGSGVDEGAPVVLVPTGGVHKEDPGVVSTSSAAPTTLQTQLPPPAAPTTIVTSKLPIGTGTPPPPMPVYVPAPSNRCYKSVRREKRGKGKGSKVPVFRA